MLFERGVNRSVDIGAESPDHPQTATGYFLKQADSRGVFGWRPEYVIGPKSST